MAFLQLVLGVRDTLDTLNRVEVVIDYFAHGVVMRQNITPEQLAAHLMSPRLYLGLRRVWQHGLGRLGWNVDANIPPARASRSLSCADTKFNMVSVIVMSPDPHSLSQRHPFAAVDDLERGAGGEKRLEPAFYVPH